MTVASGGATLTERRGQYQWSGLVAATDEMIGQRFYSGTRADLNPGDRFYHGTRADLKPGDLINPGHSTNFGKLDRITTYVYFSATLDAAI